MKFHKPTVIKAYQTEVRLEVETLGGMMIAEPGDWVVTGIKGGTYSVSQASLRQHTSRRPATRKSIEYD